MSMMQKLYKWAADSFKIYLIAIQTFAQVIFLSALVRLMWCWGTGDINKESLIDLGVLGFCVIVMGIASLTISSILREMKE